MANSKAMTKCKHCNKMFMNPWKEKTYCSMKCFRLHFKRKTAKCLVCGRVFTPSNNSYGLYCSKKCYGETKKGIWSSGLKQQFIKEGHGCRWKGGRPKCDICGKQLKGFYAKRCRKCWVSNPKKHITKEYLSKVLRRRPMSGVEEKVLNVINEFNLPYRFVGNGEFTIGRKVPDFVNINGEKKVVEVYWEKHKDQFRGGCKQWKKDRKRLFKEYGWETIFIEGTGLTKQIVLNSLTRGGTP